MAIDHDKLSKAMDLLRDGASYSVSATRNIALAEARATVRAAGFDPDRLASASDVDEMRERMTGQGGQRTIGWDPNHPCDLVFPQITKEEATRRIEARAKAGTDGPPINPMTRERHRGRRQ